MAGLFSVQLWRISLGLHNRGLPHHTDERTHTMRRYAYSHWSFAFARLAYRLERATATAIQVVQNEDHASWHFDGRPLAWREELECWWAGFKDGWRAAESSDHPWFARPDVSQKPSEQPLR